MKHRTLAVAMTLALAGIHTPTPPVVGAKVEPIPPPARLTRPTKNQLKDQRRRERKRK